MFKRQEKVYLELTDTEFRMIRNSLIGWRNQLIWEGRYTDPIDELLIKLMNSWMKDIK